MVNYTWVHTADSLCETNTHVLLTIQTIESELHVTVLYVIE